MKKIVENHIKESNKDSHFTSRMVVMAIFIAVFAFSFATLILNVEIKTLNYKEIGTANYEVCLRENTYFADECQPSGKQYIASLIRNIKTHFNYDFRIDEDINYEYSYNITAKVIATDGDSIDRVLYESEETLRSSEVISAKGDGFSIKESINVDYGKYNGLITSFRSEYGLTLKANVIVSLNVYLTGQADGFSNPLTSSQKVSLTIPLSERTINVSLDSDEVNNQGVLEEKIRDFNKNLIWIIIADVSAIIAISIFIISLIIFVSRQSRRSDYEKELSKIMKEYDSLIIEVDNMPDMSDKNTVEVNNFNELLDVRDTIEKPIIYKELVEDCCSMFMIEDSEITYIYIIGHHSFKKKLRKN